MKILVGILLLFFSCFLSAQRHKITNVKEEVIGDKIRINYDLSGKYSSTYKIDLLYSLDDGKTYNIISQESLLGDIGSTVIPGDNKQIVWDVLSERDELIGDIKLEVTSEVKIHPEVESLTSSMLVAGGGLGLLCIGIGLEVNAKNRHNKYLATKDPTDDLYGDDTRQEYYNKANKQHHVAYVMNILGTVALLGGGYKLVQKIRKNRKLEMEYKTKLLGDKATSILLQPNINWSVNERNKIYPEFFLALKF